jgi:hypothetical protein
MTSRAPVIIKPNAGMYAWGIVHCAVVVGLIYGLYCRSRTNGLLSSSNLPSLIHAHTTAIQPLHLPHPNWHYQNYTWQHKHHNQTCPSNPSRHTLASQHHPIRPGFKNSLPSTQASATTPPAHHRRQKKSHHPCSSTPGYGARTRSSSSMLLFRSLP